MMDEVHWADYRRPLPPGTPFNHPQQSCDETRRLKWSGRRLSCWAWRGPGDLTLADENFESDAGVADFRRQLEAEGFAMTRNGSYPLGPTDYDVMRDAIKACCIDAYAGFRSRLLPETLCGFALASDSDASTLSPRANTLEAVERRHKSLSRDEALFFVAEWPYDDRKPDPAFMRTMNAKREWKTQFDPQVDFPTHKKLFFEACIAALEIARKEGVFPANRHFLALVQVMDDDPLRGMFRRINSHGAWRYKRLVGWQA
jgi:hypothetical protein